MKENKKNARKKTAPRKNSVVKSDFSGNASKAFDLTEKYLGSLEGKKGFQVYQCYRDFFINLIPEPEKLKFFVMDESHNGFISDIQLFDRAYIDNFIFCATIKIKAPEIYDDLGSGFIDYSQNMTIAAIQMAEKKV